MILDALPQYAHLLAFELKGALIRLSLPPRASPSRFVQVVRFQEIKLLLCHVFPPPSVIQ